MKLECAPSGYTFDSIADNVLGVALLSRINQANIGYIGDKILLELKRQGLRPVDRAVDLLSIALSIIAADFACERKSSPDGWTRELNLKIAVRDPEFWTGQAKLLEQQLRFLTTDIWNIEFTAGPDVSTYVVTSEPPKENCVVLLSGGLDSLIGTLDLVEDGMTPYSVSQIAKGDKSKQAIFASTIGNGLKHVQFSTNVRLPIQERPPAQRARSFIFLTYGVLVATALKQYIDGQEVDLYVCENGFISINPPLTDIRLGSLSTRTTHPYFLKLYQQLLAMCGLKVNIKTPYQFHTKGEMLSSCKNQDYLLQYAHQSTSCGRFSRYGYKHCGKCVPCLIRRAAFHKWGIEDNTVYYYPDLRVAYDKRRSSFDDVWSAASAIIQVDQEGLDAWLGSALSPALLGDTTPYRDAIQRGLNELTDFLKHMGIE